MADILTTLHPENDADTNLYPNIKSNNIPDKCIDRNKLDNGINSLLNSINELHPSGVDTSTNILAFSENKGIYIGSDTGNWYYWDGTHYVSGGVYQATNINDNYITYDMLNDTLKDMYVKKFIDDSTKISLNHYQEYNSAYNYSFNGLSVVSIPVSAGMKLKYSYTSSSSDSKGLAFFRQNGNYISGVQVNNTIQEVIVPINAVLCKATIENGKYYQIQVVKDCFDIVNDHNKNVNDISNLEYKTSVVNEILTGNLYDGTYQNGYYNNSGVLVSSDTYHNITIDNIRVGDVIRAKYDTIDLYNQNGIFVDENNNFITAVRYTQTLVDNTYYEITLPNNANIKKVILNFKVTTGYVVVKNRSYNANVEYGKVYMPNLQINEQLENMDISLKNDVDYASIFRKVACIGDSITLGYYGDSGGTVYGTYPDYCYPSFLAKLINADVKNLGLSGRSTKTWYEDYSTQFSADDVNWLNYDCAIIFLGTNYGLDGNVDPTEESMLGYYCRIIEMLLNTNPNISIFLCTSPWTQNRTANFTSQIQALGEHYNLPILRLDESTLLTYEQRMINQPYDHVLHFGRVGLMRIASEVVRCINENGKDNPSYFNKLYGYHY